MTTIPPDELVVEVVNPESDHVWEVQPLDDAQYLPDVNDKPELRVPVSKSQESRWLDSVWEGAEPEMRAWQDGERLPIDELRKPETSTDKITLVGEGGQELDNPVETEVQNETVPDAVRTLLTDFTTYDYSVDGPPGGTEERLLQSLSGTDLQSALAQPLDEDQPLQFDTDGYETLQACWTTEGEAYDRGAEFRTTEQTPTEGVYSGGDSASLVRDDAVAGGPDFAAWDFTVGHTIASDNFGAAVRIDADDTNSAPGHKWTLEHPDGNSYLIDEVGAGVLGSTLTWDQIGDGAYNNLDGYEGPDLTPGDYTLRCEVTNSDGGTTYALYVDAVAPYDNRFSWLFDNSNDGSGGPLDGPQWYPDGIADVTSVAFEDASTAGNIDSGRIEATLSATDDGQSLGLSNDSGGSWSSGSNTATYSTAFTEASGTLRWRATLGRTNDPNRTETPLQGTEPQRVTGGDLYADVEDVAVLDFRRPTGSVLDILQRWAEYANAFFELRWDSATETIRVEWTRPGQRDTQSTGGLSDFSVSKDLRTYGKVTIRSSFRTRQGEQLTADHGTALELDEDDLVTGRESLIDAATGQEFTAGVDYDIDYADGEITTLANGAIGDGDALVISYQWVAQGSYEADDYDPQTDRALPPKKLNSVTSDREAEQAALVIQQDLDEPLVEATATLSRLDAGRSLISELDVDELPTDRPLEIKQLDRTAEKIVLQLGSRDTISEALQNLDRRLGATQERA